MGRLLLINKCDGCYPPYVAHVVDEGMGSSRRVPWAKFADGRVWELRRLADFDQNAELARRAAIAWATRNGWRVHTSVRDPDTLRVQFQKPEG